MASLREVARYVLIDAKAGISWLAFWKTGRSWNSEVMYGVEYDEGSNRWGFKRPSSWKIEDEDYQRLMQIHSEDNNAILVNPYYDNLGPFEEMTLESLVDGIKFQYSFGGNIQSVLNQASEVKNKE